MSYPKRLIEVDLPIRRISAHARKEKSVRNGHISTLHIWWARRPLAACRAVLCASFWIDPADENCPKEFVEFAKKEMIKWSDNNHLLLLSKESVSHFIKVNQNKKRVDNKVLLRQLLLNFIADFSDWENSNNEEFLKTARLLTQCTHIALGGEPGTNPVAFDPFAGGGAIPFEAARINFESIASDLNPIPIALNKLQIEIIPQLGVESISIITNFIDWVKEEFKRDLGTIYGYKDLNNPVAFIWARNIICEGPKCGIEIPLIRNKLIVNKIKKKILIEFLPAKNKKSVYKLLLNPKGNSLDSKGTVAGGSVTCPYCGFTTPVKNVRMQFSKKNGGTSTATLISAIFKSENDGYIYREPTQKDIDAYAKSNDLLESYSDFVPLTELPVKGTLGFRVQNYGMKRWSDLFNTRQLLINAFLCKKLSEFASSQKKIKQNSILYLLQMVLDRIIDSNSGQCWWVNNAETCMRSFGRQTVQMIWDYSEINPFSDWPRAIENAGNNVITVIENILKAVETRGTVIQGRAAEINLPDDSLDVFFTDPPYYDAIPYADLSDFYYSWHIALHKNRNASTPKIGECIVNAGALDSRGVHDKSHFYKELTKSFLNGRVLTKPTGIAVIVFAHKSTEGWESLLNSVIDSGWVVTSSWPIDTENQRRLRAQNSSALSSSVHLVCRPRESADGSLIQKQVGDWRDVQEELPKRIHEWMPRLAAEGIVGADAIFACLGPGLEVFSRYSKVVQAGSEREITLHEYLEKVWAAVSQEALNMVFSGGEAKSLEEDARLTAMWLWTLTAGASENENGADENDDDEESSGGGKISGYTLEYDTARKIAQGLGANLDLLKTLIEVKGDKARLLLVEERVSYLFGVSSIQNQPIKKKKKTQLSLTFENVEQEEESKFEMPELKIEQTGKTVLDRLHQAMLLFSTGRTDALKRFLVEDGAGKDDRFWKLAQSLTALYPKDTDERRWVEAVQTYKKSLGF